MDPMASSYLLQVDSCSAPWDFYLFHHLKKTPSSPEGLPLIGCFLYLDSCISIYMPPQDHLLIVSLSLQTPDPPILLCTSETLVANGSRSHLFINHMLVLCRM